MSTGTAAPGAPVTTDDDRREANSRPVASFLLRNPVVLLLAIVLPALAIGLDGFATTENLQNLLLETSVLALITAGSALVVLTGYFDLSAEGTLQFTSMLAGWLLVTKAPGSGWGVPAWVVIPAMVLVGAAIGLFNAFLVAKLGINAFIATLATLITLQGASLIPTKAETIFPLPAAYSWIGTHAVAGVSVIVLVAVVTYALLVGFIKTSLMGRHIYAVGGNESAARENGISTVRVVAAVFALNGALAGFASWLTNARLDSATPSANTGIIFTAFAALVIGGVNLSGGRGTLIGAAGGVILLGAVDSALNLVNVDTLYINFIRGLVILFAVLIIVVRHRIAKSLGIQERAA